MTTPQEENAKLREEAEKEINSYLGVGTATACEREFKRYTLYCTLCHVEPSDHRNVLSYYKTRRMKNEAGAVWARDAEICTNISYSSCKTYVAYVKKGFELNNWEFMSSSSYKKVIKHFKKMSMVEHNEGTKPLMEKEEINQDIHERIMKDIKAKRFWNQKFAHIKAWCGGLRKNENYATALKLLEKKMYKESQKVGVGYYWKLYYKRLKKRDLRGKLSKKRALEIISMKKKNLQFCIIPAHSEVGLCMASFVDDYVEALKNDLGDRAYDELLQKNLGLDGKFSTINFGIGGYQKFNQVLMKELGAENFKAFKSDAQRHGTIDRQLELGANENTVAMQMGHNNPKVLKENYEKHSESYKVQHASKFLVGEKKKSQPDPPQQYYQPPPQQYYQPPPQQYYQPPPQQYYQPPPQQYYQPPPQQYYQPPPQQYYQPPPQQYYQPPPQQHYHSQQPPQQRSFQQSMNPPPQEKERKGERKRKREGEGSEEEKEKKKRKTFVAVPGDNLKLVLK